MPRRPTGELVEQRTGGIEWHGRLALGRVPFATRLAGGNRVDRSQHVAVTVVLDDGWHGTGLVDGDGHEHPREETLVELPGGAVDVERAVAANAASGPRGQRRGEGWLVDRPRGRGRPDVGGSLP